jgi:hypothetical protein
MSEIAALAATADAALVPLSTNTRETDSNLASNDVKGPRLIRPKIFSRRIFPYKSRENATSSKKYFPYKP